MIWLLVPLAFAAMFCQDLLSVWLVRAEAQGRAHAAACWDTAGDAGMDALLLSSDLPLKIAVIAATLAADYAGTYTGVRLSTRLAGLRPDDPGRRRTLPDREGK